MLYNWMSLLFAERIIFQTVVEVIFACNFVMEDCDVGNYMKVCICQARDHLEGCQLHFKILC